MYCARWWRIEYFRLVVQSRREAQHRVLYRRRRGRAQKNSPSMLAHAK